MLDSIFKVGTSALLGSALGPAAPIVSGLIGKAISGGGSDPVQSLLGAIGDPFKALFGQATTQLASPFRSIPAAFSGLTGTLASAVQSLGLGNIDGQIAKAGQLMQSDNVLEQIQGRQQLDKMFAALNLLQSITKEFGNLQKEIAKF